MLRARALLALLFAATTSGVAGADEEEPPPKPRPTAPDTRAGRPTIALEAGYTRLFGTAEAGLYQSDAAGWGTLPGLQLAYPFTRHTAVELRAQAGSFSSTDACPACKTSALVVAPGLVYHLVDGAPFDPWFSFGVGYRKTEIKNGFGTTTYSGFDFLRYTIGMDYYPARAIGFGPFFGLSFGKYTSSSRADVDLGSGRALTLVGLRVVISPFSL
ncbi:MAG: hypothetical protein IT374_17220 [Polyangiaceae bacterium]|nr:hypothetical protein [Polyangiaceae bacterium]